MKISNQGENLVFIMDDDFSESKIAFRDNVFGVLRDIFPEAKTVSKEKFFAQPDVYMGLISVFFSISDALKEYEKLCEGSTNCLIIDHSGIPTKRGEAFRILVNNPIPKIDHNLPVEQLNKKRLANVFGIEELMPFQKISEKRNALLIIQTEERTENYLDIDGENNLQDYENRLVLPDGVKINKLAGKIDTPLDVSLASSYACIVDGFSLAAVDAMLAGVPVIGGKHHFTAWNVDDHGIKRKERIILTESALDLYHYSDDYRWHTLHHLANITVTFEELSFAKNKQAMIQNVIDFQL